MRMKLALLAFAASAITSAVAEGMAWQYAAYSDPMTDAKKEVAGGGVTRGPTAVFSCWSGRLVAMINTQEFVGDSRKNGPSDGQVYYSYRVGQEVAVMRKVADLSADNKTLVVMTDEAAKLAQGFFRSPVMFQIADYNGETSRFIIPNDGAENALRQLSCASKYFPPAQAPAVAEGSGTL